MPIRVPVAIPDMRELRTQGLFKKDMLPAFADSSWSDHSPPEAAILEEQQCTHCKQCSTGTSKQQALQCNTTAALQQHNSSASFGSSVTAVLPLAAGSVTAVLLPLAAQ